MYSTNIYWTPSLYGGFPDGSVVEESTCNIGVAGDVGSIAGLRGSPEGGNGNPLHYSCLGNHMDRGAWWATVRGLPRVGYNRAAKHAHVLCSSNDSYYCR